MIKLVNLTNHDITFTKVVDGEQKKAVLKPSKMWARMNQLSNTKIGDVTVTGSTTRTTNRLLEPPTTLEVPIFEKSEFYTNVKWGNRMFGLPSPKKDTYYIVSWIVAYHNLERKDLLIPETNSNKNTQYLYRMVI